MFKVLKKVLFIGVFLIIPIYPKDESSLKILFCMRRFPTNTAWFVLNQMVELIKSGHEVSIYTKLLDTQSINIKHPEIIKHGLLKKTFTKITKKEDYDIILCQSAFLAPHIIGLKKNGLLTGKLIMFVREAFKGELLQNSSEIFDNVDLVMPVCDYFKNRLIEFGCPEDKIIVLHSAIDCSKFQFRERVRKKGEPIILVTTSRLNEKKRIHDSISAIKLIIKKHPKLRYFVLGEGRYRPKLEALIKKFRLSNNVKLLGWQTPVNVARILDRAHIFLHPSATSSAGHQEGIPNAIMEALAMGLPVISTWHAGIPELVKDKISGFLIPEKNVAMLAERIDYLIKNPKLWPKMGRAGRAMVEENFDKKIENKRLEKICIDLAR